MKVNILKRDDPGYPEILKPLEGSPAVIHWAGADPNDWLDKPKLAVVGSRKVSNYGRMVTEQLVHDLAAAEVVIISGLAYGVDAIAHQAALRAGGITVAVLPTSLDKIYPAGYQNLARQITEQSGTLISEYSRGDPVYKYNFIVRNRIVTGVADGLLITEASLKSGSLHTARFALEQGKTVMAVPGNITSLGSAGTNNLIKSGALPVTDATDVLFALGVHPAKQTSKAFRGSDSEEEVLRAIRAGELGHRSPERSRLLHWHGALLARSGGAEGLDAHVRSGQIRLKGRA